MVPREPPEDTEWKQPKVGIVYNFINKSANQIIPRQSTILAYIERLSSPIRTKRQALSPASRHKLSKKCIFDLGTHLWKHRYQAHAGDNRVFCPFYHTSLALNRVTSSRVGDHLGILPDILFWSFRGLRIASLGCDLCRTFMVNGMVEVRAPEACVLEMSFGNDEYGDLLLIDNGIRYHRYETKVIRL